MHWLISQFPELDHLEPDQRQRVLRRIPWWTYPTTVIRALIPSLVLGGIAGLLLANRLGSDTLVLIGVPLAAALAIGLYLQDMARIRREMRRVIADGFRGERTPFCFHCGYNLRTLTAPRCPECGHPTQPPPPR